MRSSQSTTIIALRCFVRNTSGEILIVKRSTADRSLPGLWEAPGGKLNQGETLIEALHNEILEETGYTIRITSPFCFVDSNISQSPFHKDSLYIIHFYLGEVVSGTYTKLLAYELTTETRRAASFFRDSLERDILPFTHGTKPILNIAWVQAVVCRAHNIEPSDIISECRTMNLTKPRWIAMWLCTQLVPNLSLVSIGKEFGGRDHTSVLHGIKKINDAMQASAMVRYECEELLRRIKEE